MAAHGKDIEIDRLLMNNDRQGGRGSGSLETSLHLKASELEAASLALIEDKDRYRKPSHDVRHTFYGMFHGQKEEFRYDILQEEIAALPTIYNETGRNPRSGAAAHGKPSEGRSVPKAAKSHLGKGKGKLLKPAGMDAHVHLHPTAPAPARVTNIFRRMNQQQEDSHFQLSSAFPFYPASITKTYSLGDFEQAIMGHYKLPLLCLPPAFYRLPCVRGGRTMAQLAEASCVEHRVFLVVLWRPSSAAGQSVAMHYEKLARQFPDLITVAHVIAPKYADEQSYLNSMCGGGGVPDHIFLDEHGHMTHDLLAPSHAHSHDGPEPDLQAQKIKLPAVLMCLPSDVDPSAEPGVAKASLQPQFCVPGGEGAGGTTASTASLGSTSGAEYYNCHTVLFAVQDARCISAVAGFAVGALLGMYCSAQRPGQYLQDEVTTVVTDPAWAHATWLASSAGDSFVASKSEQGGFYTETVARMGQGQAQVVPLGDMMDLDLQSEDGDGESKEQKSYTALDSIQQAHYEVVKAMLDHCVTGCGTGEYDCLQHCMQILPALSDAAPAGLREAYAAKLERYSESWECLADAVSPCGGSGEPARFLPYLYRMQSRNEVDCKVGAAQEAGLSLGMLQHLQKKLHSNVYVTEYIQHKRELRQRYLPPTYHGDTIGMHGSPPQLSSPSPSHTPGNNLSSSAEGLLEPEWDAILYHLRMGLYEEAYNIARDFVAPAGTALSRSFSNERGDDSVLVNTTAHSMSSTGDAMRSTTRSLGSRDRYQRYQRLQQRGKSRNISGRSPEDREALLENVRIVLRALVVASGSLHAMGALGVAEVRAAVAGIWEHILEHQRALSAERKEQRYYQHAHRYDGDNIGGSVGGTPSRSGDGVHSSGGSTKKGRRGSGGGFVSPSAEQATHVLEVNAHKQCVLLLLTTCGSSCANFRTGSVDDASSGAEGLNLLDALQKAEGADLEQQDVLWAFVWEIYWGRAFYDAAAHDTGADVAGQNVVAEHIPPSVYTGLTIHALYSQVLNWGGAQYFDPAQADPYDYVRVLLCCQQFAAAVAHLRQVKQTIPAVHLAVVCLYLGLLAPLDPLCDEVSDGHGHVVDLLESGTTIGSFVEEYALADVAPAVSAAYLLMSLVPQCLSTSAMKQHPHAPLKFHLRIFLGSLERLHLHVGSFSRTRALVLGHMSQYIRENAVFGALVSGLGHRMLTAHRRVGEAMKMYQLAGELADDSAGSGSTFLQGVEEVLREAAHQMYTILLSSHQQQRTYIRAAAQVILQQIQGEDGELRGELAVAGVSRARILGLCGDVSNLESFCKVIDYCMEVDRAGSAGRVDVQDMLANKFLKVRWALRSPYSKGGSGAVELVGLVPASAQAMSRISSALVRQLNTEQAKLYDEALLHTASYLQRLAHFVHSGKGSSGSVITDHATSNELRVLVAHVSAVRDCIAVSAESYMNNVAGITNWAAPVPQEAHAKRASARHGGSEVAAGNVDLNHRTPNSKHTASHSTPLTTEHTPSFNASLDLENEYEQTQYDVYMAQAAQQKENLRTRLTEQLSSKKAAAQRYGLANLGNSCYLSCIVQCLAHVSPLAAHLVTGEYLPVYTTSDASASMTFPSTDEHCITHRFAALLACISSSAGAAASPALEREWLAFTRSVRLLHHRVFDNTSQQDAEEFLGWLLTRMEAELKLGRAEQPLVQRMFNFTRRCNWTCEVCGKHTTGPSEASSRLLLQKNPNAPLGTSSLTEWLEYATRWERGCDHNCNDPACAGEKATMRYSIEQSSLPPVLIVHLNRSKNVEDKDVTAVDFPVHALDMQPYCNGTGSSVYDLFAFCNHVGGSSLKSGHYLAYARDSKAPSEAWSEFDDSKVTAVRSVDDLLSTPYTQNDNNTHAENYYSGSNHSNRDARRDVYILFYKKRA